MIGGAVGAWVMNEYIAAEQRRNQRLAQRRASQHGQRAATSQPRQKQPRQKQQPPQAQRAGGDDATVKTAQAISRRLFHHELSPAEKKIAGPVVHYGYGALGGAIYGALTEVWPLAGAGFGLLYGMMLWLLGDEIAVPALGLGPPPTKVPVRAHADYLGAHLAYGIALDVARRVARHLL
jgi:putative membrane protein